MANIEKTACRYAWTYPIIDMGRAELRNCCRTPFNTIAENDWKMGIDIFKKLEAIRQVKRDLLTGVKTEKCRTCWTSEEYGIGSPRSGLEDFIRFLKVVKWHNLTHEQIKSKLYNLSDAEVEELVDIEHPEHVELSLATTCDLKCVYCSHVFSTQWAAERLKFGEITIEQLPKNSSEEYEKIWWEWFEKVASKTVHKITFVGGEPLINDKFYEYVDRLIDYYETSGGRKLHIFVATNLNTPAKFFSKFKQAIQKIINSKNVSIGIGLSFESVGHKNEIIRSNSDWGKFDWNVGDLINYIVNNDHIRGIGGGSAGKADIVIMPAINSLSVSSLPDFLRYIISMRDGLNRALRISTTHVTYPMRYSPFILPQDFIKYIDEAIDILKGSKWYGELPVDVAGSWISFAEYLATIKNSILNGTNDEILFARREFANDIKKLGARRNFNFEQSFPEMANFYKQCLQ